MCNGLVNMIEIAVDILGQPGQLKRKLHSIGWSLLLLSIGQLITDRMLSHIYSKAIISHISW